MNATIETARLALPVSPRRDHVRGPDVAPVTLVEYGDYECPYCAAAHPVIEAVREAMGPKLRFVYRHFPLSTVHPYAQQAAEAAEEAGAHKRFWPMHDVLFAHHQALDEQDLLNYASMLKLNVTSFQADLGRHVHLPKVREDFMSGVHSGVNGTPAFYINDMRYDGSWEMPMLLAALRQAAQS